MDRPFYLKLSREAKLQLDVLREQIIRFTNGPHGVGRPEFGTETEVGCET